MKPISNKSEFLVPEWIAPFYEEWDDWQYFIAYGGRGSSKTESVVQFLVHKAARANVKIISARETMESQERSSRDTFEQWIHRLGYTDIFHITRTKITCVPTKSTIQFIGVNPTHAASEESVKGLVFDIFWFEEAQRMSAQSWELIYPTLRRPGAKIIATFNPKHRYDPIYSNFVAKSNPFAKVIKVNFQDNPWFPEESERARQTTLQNEPHRYAHIWLGEPDDHGDEQVLLTFEDLMVCVNAYKTYAPNIEKDIHDIGLDVADKGVDKNAIVVKSYSCIEHAESFSSDSIRKLVDKVDETADGYDDPQLYYDSGGIGVAVRELYDGMECDYGVIGLKFGERVSGAERRYSYGYKNKDFFARKNSQLAWALKLRVERTKRLVGGEDIDPEECLFINPSIPYLDNYLAQLSQPQWSEDISGRIKIDKAPNNSPSPDLYDATVLAFASDSDGGLQAD